MRRIISLIFFIVLAFGFAADASAATYYWVGGTTNSNTSTAANWSTTAGACADSANTNLPTASDDIRFGGVGNCQNGATIDSALSVNNLYLAAPYSGTVTQSESVTIAANYTHASGTFISNPAKTFSVGGSFSVPSAGASGSFSRFTGAGTSDSHYIIYDVYGLQGMQGFLTGKYFDLANNIEATSTALWNSNGSGGYYGFSPIGNDVSQFSGVFDGKNYTISNLYINRPGASYVGLFGYSTNSIRNVGLVGGSLFGGYRVGGLVGYNNGVVGNSYVTYNVSSDQGILGGLVGYNYTAGVISDSYATGNVTHDSFQFFFGGLVGGNWGTIINSYATGNVNGFEYVGGLVGSSLTGSVTNSYATGNVTHTNSQWGSGNFGGLVGYNQSASTISNSYATGNVFQGNNIIGNVGGFAGRNDGVIRYSYSTGVPNGNSNVGGFVGLNSAGTYTANYWDTTTSTKNTGVGGSNVAGVTGTTTALMKTEGTFSGWNFTTPWVMPADSYPILAPYTITVAAGAHGAISPSGATRLASRGSQTYTITPAAGYSVNDVLVNGISVGVVPSYSFSNVLANHSITATFSGPPDPSPLPEPGSQTAVSVPVLSYDELVRIFGDRAVRTSENSSPVPATVAPESFVVQSGIVPLTGTHTFGQRSSAILSIQRILNSDPSTRIAESGAGSPGKETDMFGLATRAAVRKFQIKHGIVASPKDQGYGVVGPKTRSKLNQLAGKSQ